MSARPASAGLTVDAPETAAVGTAENDPVNRQPTPGTRVTACRHCGAPLLDDRMRETGFCCAGCAFVFRLVHENDLEGYYRLKDPLTVPADRSVFESRDYGWLEELQHVAEADERAVPELTLAVQGISCVGCVWLIERLFRRQPGAREIIVNAQMGSMVLRWTRGEFQAASFARILQSFGYLAGPADLEEPEGEGRDLLKRIGLCAAFTLNAMLFTLPVYFGMGSDFAYARLFSLLSLVFATLSLLVGGSYFLSRAWNAVRAGALHIDLPVALGIAGAYLGSLYGWAAGRGEFVYFDFVCTFILLMLIGRWAQVSAVERNRRRILRQQPAARRILLADGASVAPETVKTGDRMRIASGQTVPVASRLESAGTFSLASINGEAEPRLFAAGARVPSGAVNAGRDHVALVAEQAWRESLLARLLESDHREPARNPLLERIVKGYLIGILGVAVVSGVGWGLATGDASRSWSVVIAVLVVSCPCAIGLAFPLADEMAAVAVRRRGVYVRSGDLWSRLSHVRDVVFDKTGTLTMETPLLLNPEVLDGLDAEAREALHLLVRDTPHPVCQSLLENLLARGNGPSREPTGDDVRETIGSGVEFDDWSLGRPGWRDRDPAACQLMDDKGTGEAEGDAVLAHRGSVVARFQFSDTARSDARREIVELQHAGLRVSVLSGDRAEKVRRLADELGLPEERTAAACTPEGKATWLLERGADSALMVGDGANDSLAFDQALCRGTPVVHRGFLESKADFFYLGRGIGGIRALFEINRHRRRTQALILVFSVAYNVVAVGFAVAGLMNPLIAAVLMPLNSLATLAIVTIGMRDRQTAAASDSPARVRASSAASAP